MKADATDRFYNVGTGLKTTIAELVELILEVTNSRVKPEFHPGGTTFVKNRVGCPERAAKEIGFTADTPLREGIERLVDWRRTHVAEVEQRRLQAGVAA